MGKSKIITNSTPIIGLSIIGKLPLLKDLFETVYVPEAVFKEVVVDSTRGYGEEDLKEAISTGMFKIYKIRDSETVRKMHGKLHKGELEVIVGAKELNLQIVAIDERAARDLAQMLLLRPIGTLGILLLAKKQKKIDKIKPYLDTLIEYNFYISKKLYQQILANADEI